MLKRILIAAALLGWLATPALAADAGVPADTAKISPEAQALQAKAEKGDAQAEFDLGVAYARGNGVPVSTTEAIRWWRKAADQGHAGAEYELGQLNYDGIVIPRDYKEAFRLFSGAAKQDVLAAQFFVSLCYGDGLGTEKNDTEAYFWALVAKKRGWKVSPVLLDKFAHGLTADKAGAVRKRAREWEAAHGYP